MRTLILASASALVLASSLSFANAQTNARAFYAGDARQSVEAFPARPDFNMRRMRFESRPLEEVTPYSRGFVLHSDEN